MPPSVNLHPAVPPTTVKKTDYRHVLSYRLSPLTAGVLIVLSLLAGYGLTVLQVTKLCGRVGPGQVIRINPWQTVHYPDRTPPIPGVGPTVGSSSATISVVEFTDYECPLCARFFTESLSHIQQDYIRTGKVRFEVRNFPITAAHPNATIAAEAASCALQQNKFWQMHDALFTHQDAWAQQADPLAAFQQFAADQHLDVAAFTTCVQTHQSQAALQRDVDDAKASAISGTPSFWVFGPNGQVKQINGAYPYSFFQQTFDVMLRK